MRSRRALAGVLLVAAEVSWLRSVAAWRIRTAVFDKNRVENRWTSSTAVRRASSHPRRIRTRAERREKTPSTPPHGCASRDASIAEDPILEGVAREGADGDVELGEAEELLDTVVVTPEQIAEFFAQPSYEPVDSKASADICRSDSEDLLDSKHKHVVVMDSFLEEKTASALRGIFEDRFSNPREGKAERFVWDWWHVKDQYTLMRTPAEDYFGEKAFSELFEELIKFGQETLGCTTISPPWLSFYVDGCEQRFHTDSWHGPWAFVLSLTDWENREFTGGETMILKPHVLDYWRSFEPGVGLEEKHFLDLVDPRFNRLTVFDPRFPHGVRPVGGTRDPLKARLVLHGWFADPQPFFTGGLTADEATEPLNDALAQVYPALEDVGRVTGVLTVRLHVSGESGRIVRIVALTDTLIADPNDFDVGDEGVEEDARGGVLEAVQKGCRGAEFPTAEEDTFITVPFVFE